jgi:hypothetical protein
MLSSPEIAGFSHTIQDFVVRLACAIFVLNSQLPTEGTVEMGKLKGTTAFENELYCLREQIFHPRHISRSTSELLHSTTSWL